MKSKVQGGYLKIIIDPSQTLKEMKVVDNSIGLTRGLAVKDYLKDKFGIDIDNPSIEGTIDKCIIGGRIKTSDKKHVE